MGHVSKKRITNTKQKLEHAHYVRHVQKLSQKSASPVQTKSVQRSGKKKEESKLDRKSPPFWTWNWTTSYMLTAFSAFVAVITMTIHGLELVIGWRFQSFSIAYNSVALLCGLVVTGMTINVYKELGKLG